MYNGMPYDLVQGQGHSQGHGGQNDAKMADFCI